MSFKKFVKIITAFVFVFLAPSVLFSDDIKKAEKYYRSYDFKYALEIYLKIMEANPKMEIAERIANCYRYINDTEQAETWYAKTLAYPNANPQNLKYLADAQKQNEKFDEAAASFKSWGEKLSDKSELATALANACNTAKVWRQNPDIGAEINNKPEYNSTNADFSPFAVGDEIVISSDRWANKEEPKLGKKPNNKEIFGWTGNPYIKLYKIGKNGAQSFDKNINIGYHNGPGILTKSGDTLFFTRVISPQKKAKIEADRIAKKYILYAVKKDAEWLVKDKLPFNETGQFSVQHPALSPNGQILYFASDMPGGYGQMDIYYCQRQPNGTWSAPKNCGSEINTEEDDVFPMVRADGKFFFASKGHIGIGGLDIFSAEGEKNTFKNVENLRSPINSPKDDFGIMFYKNDITKGLLSSNRKGGVGSDDIYEFKLGQKAAPKDLAFAISGAIVDKQTENNMPNITVTLINIATKGQQSAISDESGKFAFKLDPESEYILKGDTEKFYTFNENTISTKGLQESTIFEIKVELEKTGSDIYTIQLNNIYYDFDKYNIRKDAIEGLDKVNQFMVMMPNVHMDLFAHTDSRGTKKYNLILSEKRAESAKNYLIKSGIATNRLAAHGKGESQLLNQCKDGAKCSETEHQLNRRTEFKIVKMTPVVAPDKKKILP